MSTAVTPARRRWSIGRLWLTARYYRRRAWRWWCVLAEYRPGSVHPDGGRRRVLVVRLDAIGDFVLWSGAARVLRRWLGADAHVTLVANEAWAELARDAGIADEVWPVQRQRLEWDSAYRAGLRARVQGGRFSMAINPRYTREMMLGDSVVRWSRARERIGPVGEGHLLPARERRWADAWYTRLIRLSDGPMHETERHAEFLRALGVSLAEVPAPALRVTDDRIAALDDVHEGYFVVFPGASLVEKRWSARNFAMVARHVREVTGWRAVLLGDATDTSSTRAIAGELGGAIDLAGATSVCELVSVIRRARLVLTNDSAAVHIAAATGVPTVCVAGGGHWQRFVPYPSSLGAMADLMEVVSLENDMTCFNCNWRCVLPHVAGEALPCVSRVPVERVIGAVDRVLSRVVTEPNG